MTGRRVLITLLFLALPLFAKDNSTPTMTAAANGDTIRFIGGPAVCEMRVQILSASGEPLLDSTWNDGNLFDWNAGARSLPNGSYRCVAFMRDLNGMQSERSTMLVVENGHVSIDASDANPKVTLLAHDGQTGSIINSKGDLTFRFGDFLARSDAERMRITADGKVGIGTSNPQATLDVNGTIRASGGIILPDGTLLMSAAGAPSLPRVGEGPAPIANADATPRITNMEVRNREMERMKIAKESRHVPFRGEPMIAPESKPFVPRSNSPAYQFLVDGTGVHLGNGATFALNVTGSIIATSGIGAGGSVYTTNGAINTYNGSIGVPATASLANGTYMINNIRFGHAYGSFNSFMGLGAGNYSMTGGYNSAAGYGALAALTTGNYNAAMGSFTLQSLNSGSYNTAMGEGAAEDMTTGGNNAAFGDGALSSNIGGTDNVAVGASSMWVGTSGSYNTAVGYDTLPSVTGTYNIAIGALSGLNVTSGNYNIDIGNYAIAESATTRIGDSNQTRTFISGIRGVTTGSANAVAVLIDSNGQLGTVSSSRRYKFDIHDAGNSTDALMRLRPVTFRYLKYGAGGPLQYGLIAEEVADVYPELVARNDKGEVETVMYQFLAPMLLNEVQKQHRVLEEQQSAIDKLTATVNMLTERMQALEKQASRPQPPEGHGTVRR